MASLFGSWGSDPFGELVEKATSELLPAGQEDIALNLEICDQVRSKQVPPKQAMQTIKRRLSHKNPNVVLLALGLTDICIKNGGDHFLAEVASREFMDNLESILRSPAGINFDVKTKALKLLQNWAQISESKPLQMGYIVDMYKSLKSSGFEFPAPDPNNVVSAALVETLTAPEWTDGEVCMRCRTAFTTFNRKHHCRNCGNVYCQDCSSKTMALPWFGVGQDVRVCESCYSKRGPPKVVSDGNQAKPSRSKSTNVVPSGRGGVGSHQRSNTIGAGSSRVSRSSARKKEEDDLALAIKLSLESSDSISSRPGFDISQPPVREGRPTKQADGRMMEGTDADDDPDLAAAIAASLREYAPPQPSAPDDDGRATPKTNAQIASFDGSTMPLPPSLELPASDVDAILTFSQDALAQEMYFRQNRRWQANAGQQHQLQTGYESATSARPRMAKTLDEATRRHGVLVSMHDKLSEAVRLYDRLLDAQMTRPAYGIYKQQNSLPPTDYYNRQPQSQYTGEVTTQQRFHSSYVPGMSNPSLQPVAGQGQPSSNLYPVPPLRQPNQVSSAPYAVHDISHDSSAQSSSLSYTGPESPSPYHGPTQQYMSYDAVRDPNQGFNQRSEQSYGVPPEQNLTVGQMGPMSPTSLNGQVPQDVRSMYNGAFGPSSNAYQSYNGSGYGAPNDVSAYNVHSPYHSADQMTPKNAYQSPSQGFRQVNSVESQQNSYLTSLNQSVASMAISAPPLESPSIYETGAESNYSQQPNVPVLQNAASALVDQQHGQTQQLPQQLMSNLPNYQQAPYEIIQQASAPQQNVAPQIAKDVAQSSEWRPVPIADSTSVIASAPHPPVGRIEEANVNIPSLPSAPITSPSNMKHAIAAGYDDLASPVSPNSTKQNQPPWNRPMETALIDL